MLLHHFKLDVGAPSHPYLQPGPSESILQHNLPLEFDIRRRSRNKHLESAFLRNPGGLPIVIKADRISAQFNGHFLALSRLQEHFTETLEFLDRTWQ